MPNFVIRLKLFWLKKIDQTKVIQLLLILYFNNVILKVLNILQIVKLVKTI